MKKNTLTKILAIAGTALVWIHIALPVFFSLVRTIQRGWFRSFDYLMPAEFFLLALAGMGLLIWAAARAGRRQKLIAWASAIALALLVAGQSLAVASGLASGASEPEGLAWALTLGSVIAYDLLLIVIGVGGILLIRDLFRGGVRE